MLDIPLQSQMHLALDRPFGSIIDLIWQRQLRRGVYVKLLPSINRAVVEGDSMPISSRSISADNNGQSMSQQMSAGRGPATSRRYYGYRAGYR